MKELLALLEKKGSKQSVENMARRYGIVTTKAFGASVADIRAIAKSVGKDHAMARRLWATGVYDARMLAVFVAEPAKVTAKEMEEWCRDFDNWAICDTACFHLWDRLPDGGLMDAKIRAWSARDEEFVKRAAFALIASVALHRKEMKDEALLKYVPMAVRAAGDGRNFVKKGASWALRGMGRRKGATTLRVAVLDAAAELAASDDATERWVGKDVLRDVGKKARRH